MSRKFMPKAAVTAGQYFTNVTTAALSDTEKQQAELQRKQSRDDGMVSDIIYWRENLNMSSEAVYHRLRATYYHPPYKV